VHASVEKTNKNYEIAMKSENRIVKTARVNRFRPIASRQPNSEKRGARSCVRGKTESKRERQRKAVLDVLRKWSVSELSRRAPEIG
jgi:hypothetical protein